jgi:hypothetical protein
MAAQGYRDSANQQNMATSMAQLNFMNSTMAPYPDVGLYSQLAQQAGSKVEMNPSKVALAAGGGTPQASPGLLPSTGAGRPIGGFGPQGAGFYMGGGGFDSPGPASGASILIPASAGYAGPTNASYNPAPSNSGYESPTSWWKGGQGQLVAGYGGFPQSPADYSNYSVLDEMGY